MPLDGIDLNDLDKSFGGFTAGDATPNKSASDKSKMLEGIDLKELDNHFGEGLKRVYITKKAEPEKTDISSTIANPDIAKGLWQGLKDVPNTGASLIGYIDSKLSDAGSKRNEDFNKRLEAEKATLPVDNTAFDVGRMGGQVLATGPLMAVATPEMAALKSVPIVGKLASSVARGAFGGSIFGAATNSTNDEGLVNNVGTNAAYGAAAGPLVEGGAKVASKAISKISDIAEKIRIENIVKNTGIDANAARNTLARLTDAGYTPQQAEVALQRMGGNSTIADLSPSLADEAGGIAAKGGAPSDILKGRFGDRAANSNSVAHDIMETKLGTKPNYEAEKLAAKLDRQQQTSADYNRAKSSNMALDVMPIAKDIATKLENAVGSEAKELHEIGSYLFNNNGDIKTDTAPLLKVRQALDDRLSKLKSEGTSAATSTYRSVSNIRDELNKVLKTNPDLAIADAKYAKLRQDFEGLDLGKKSVSNTGNYDNFEREFNNASSEKQEFMRKGLRIQIGDQMEKATRGELSEAQRLFGKSSSNRKIIKLAFGRDGDDVLNALEKEANQRAVEQTVSRNSLTASRQSIQSRPEYGGSSEAGIFGPIAQGAMLDIATGTPGGATAIGAGKGLASKVYEHFNKDKVKKTLEGTADLLSRQSQHGRTDALDILERINGVTGRNKSKLPVNYNGIGAIATRATLPVGIATNKKLSSLVDDFRGVGK